MRILVDSIKDINGTPIEEKEFERTLFARGDLVRVSYQPPGTAIAHIIYIDLKLVDP